MPQCSLGRLLLVSFAVAIGGGCTAQPKLTPAASPSTSTDQTTAASATQPTNEPAETVQVWNATPDQIVTAVDHAVNELGLSHNSPGWPPTADIFGGRGELRSEFAGNVIVLAERIDDSRSRVRISGTMTGDNRALAVAAIRKNLELIKKASASPTPGGR